MTPAVSQTTARARRLARVRHQLHEQGLGAALLIRPEHLRYFAGTNGGGMPAALVVTRDTAVLIAAAGLAPAETLKLLGIELCAYRGYDASRLVDRPVQLVEALASAARRLGVRGRLGVETTHVTHAVLQAIPDPAPHDLTPAVAGWRAVKDDTEQALIRRRVAMLDGAFVAVEAVIRPGASERDVLAAAHRTLLDQVEEPLVLHGNLASGARTAADNPRATARRLEPGDLVLVDLYPVLDGYAADCTRTFVVGKPNPLQRKRHAALEAALAAAESRLRPGTDVSAIDDAVRATLRAAGGYDATMTHHSGHGVGLLAWEDPWIGPGAPGALAEGMAIAIEPGLYVPGWGGMRLEGNYLITATGFDRLDRFPSTLIAVDG